MRVYCSSPKSSKWAGEWISSQLSIDQDKIKHPAKNLLWFNATLRTGIAKLTIKKQIDWNIFYIFLWRHSFVTSIHTMGHPCFTHHHWLLALFNGAPSLGKNLGLEKKTKDFKKSDKLQINGFIKKQFVQLKIFVFFVYINTAQLQQMRILFYK